MSWIEIFLSKILWIIFIISAPVQTTMVLQPTTAPVVTSTKSFGRKIKIFADGDSELKLYATFQQL